MTLWHIDIEPSPGQPDHVGVRIAIEAADLNSHGPWRVRSSRGFLIEGDLTEAEIDRLARDLFVDRVVETYRISRCPESVAHSTSNPPHSSPVDSIGSAHAGVSEVVHVIRLAGVTDPEGESALSLLHELKYSARAIRTVRSYRITGPDMKSIDELVNRVLANSAVERAIKGPILFDRLESGSPYRFVRREAPIRELGAVELGELSRSWGLSLNIDEMRAIQAHFIAKGREPTDCELETIAQTWSEHCSHKTLKGRVEFEGEEIDNLLKHTIFQATRVLEPEWVVSVFADNAGIVEFDDDYDVCFKVETHNHPSAIDPYGGANTGLGGVIRDPLGTGLGAKPICNTDVFCTAPPETPAEALPPGVLHPRRILQGVVAGVRDYGNRMGIPTVNGALVVDPAYLANPLVFCGTVGVIPKGMAFKEVKAGDRIVVIGGKTGRDGIHGATFSSAELTGESESASSGAVQIGDAIVEKIVLDVVLRARDRGLFRAITDCGAGGLSSAVGEMGASVGAEVELDKAPLKYEGLSYTEIWISESQERMVLATPAEHWAELKELCAAEGVIAADIGRFIASGKLTLKYQGHVVADLEMDFLHDGRPQVLRRAKYDPPPVKAIAYPAESNHGEELLKILGSHGVCSKEWIIRQYDHEVQARTVLKPLTGVMDDGPGDASVVLPVLGSTRGLAVACGINPRYGAIDPYAMACASVDEAIRNCVAVGADPDRIALLDNFCWGNPERPETLGSLVLAARGCHDAAIGYRAPFISGKDSLYNEYTHDGRSRAIPPTLLISAIGRVPDVNKCVTMDLKAPGDLLFIVGETRDEMGGSHWSLIRGIEGGFAPRVDFEVGRRLFAAMHRAIVSGLVKSCHDPSEGGLAVAVAEMAIAGGMGADVSLAAVPRPAGLDRDLVLLFSESPTRFIVEVEPRHEQAFLKIFENLPSGRLGLTTRDDEPRLRIRGVKRSIAVDLSTSDMKTRWQAPLAW